MKSLEDDKRTDAISFAELMKSTRLPDEISIGKFILKGRKGVKDNIQYNSRDIDLLVNSHEYTFPIQDGDLQVSLQLYENIAEYYRLFCYTSINGKQGMTFFLNLTTEKESENVIYLTQKIKFSERYEGNPKIAQAHRRQKQEVLCSILRKLGYDITESYDLILGIFDPVEKKLVNTSIDKFLNDFIVASILKGHFQGNKGYQLEILPSYSPSVESMADNDSTIVSLPLKVVENKTKRNIPLSWRYKVLKRDSFKCVACGNGASDGAKLHIDHKLPFSLGGLTELGNLQTLCSECNISKSNRFIDN
jgi:hypothetical protein